ncbi:MAG: VWA domain-containing protein [Acidobacteriota bacterium]
MLLGLVGSASASTVDESAPVFLEQIDVRAVDVEVVVRKGGEAVTGLAAEDFRILLDGDEVPIDAFAEIHAGATDAGPVVTRYLVFVDDDFSVPSRRNAVLRELSDQVELMAAQDRMAVVAWDGKQVQLLSSWRGPDESLREVLEQAMDRPAYGLKRHSEWSRLQSAMSYQDRLGVDAGRSFSSIGFSGASRPGTVGPRSAAQLQGRVGQLSSALASAMRGFGQADGRRVALFLSGALPPFESDRAFVNSRSNSLDRLSDRVKARRFFSSAVMAANRLGYTIYPVDVGGAAGALGTLGVSADIRSVGEAAYRRRVARDDEAHSDDPLLFMAEATGGRALLDGARLQALRRVIADTRSYYRFGITPQGRGDDGEQRLQIEWLGGSGAVEIRARRGFLDLSPTARVTMAVESAHLFDLPLPQGVGFGVEVADFAARSRGRIAVPLTLRFPASGFTFLPGSEGEVARLELRIAASDDRGETADVPVVPIEVLRGEIVDGEVTWSTVLELRRRPHRLLLAIHDPLGERVLAQRLSIEPRTKSDPSRR